MDGAKSQVPEKKEVMLSKSGDGGLNPKDVKNEECSGWVIENKGEIEVLWMD
ncbi:MAG: hypothetical protein ABSG32_08600 [Terriglobia bacterium]|jgi:hypothetical protein